jgi:hypothetical protein
MLYPEQETGPFLDAVAEFNRRVGESGESGQTCAVALCGRHEPENYSRWPFVRVLGPVGHSTARYMLTRSTALFYPTWPGRYTGFSGKFFEQVVSGRPVLIAFRPSPDLEEFARRFDSVTVAHEPEELIGALERVQREGGGASAVAEVATKKYWAGELAKFLDEILDGSGAAVAP